ncbi:DUF3103 family protein [Micromonospora sp. NPDC092111]|uniref:DUF3103 family protein n=1 Tax=Micromonospora sp. NPDC092111 TaxID=3364289 RepID=UPI00382E6688
MKQPRGSRLLVVAVVGALAATGLSAAATAAPVPARVAAAPTVSPVQQIKDDLNQHLLRALQDEVALRVFLGRMVRDGQADLLTVLADAGSPAGVEFSRYATEANDRVIDLKGLDGMRGSALRARLGDPAMARQLEAGVPPLLAAGPGDSAREGTFPAYDLGGRQVDLDLVRPADVPVVLVELDDEAISPVGMRVLSAELNALGMASDLVVSSGDVRETEGGARKAAGASQRTAGGAQYPATRLDRIFLHDDQEPWVKGRAEIYGLVMGQGKNGKGRTDVVDMTYLDYDGKTYYPHQQLINWSNFTWNAVDLLLMEEDDGTNYKSVAKAVVGAILGVLGAAAYLPLVNLVLSVLPPDEDDYVDAFYMMSREQSGTFLGVSANAIITVVPLVVTS